MAITATGLNAATNTDPVAATAYQDKSKLGKDDFLKLLLVQLQYQDPTEPTDTEAILSQTSQLATLESAQNTNNALDTLATSLQTSQEFSIISAIGKRADLGSDSISQEEGSSSTFEIYFPEDIMSGIVDITDTDGNIVATMPIELPKDADGNVAEQLASGVHQFTWNGLDSAGNTADGGLYHVNASYTDVEGNSQKARLGAYPIESVKFEEGKALVKLGSNYVPLENIAEVY